MSATLQAREPLSLRQVLGQLELIGAEDIFFTACEIDPAEIRPGCLFVAVPGARRDPYAAAYEAAARGAAAVVADQFLPELGSPLCLVPNPVAACARTAHALAGYPSRDISLVGLVGDRSSVVAQAYLEAMVGGLSGSALSPWGDVWHGNLAELASGWWLDPRAPACLFRKLHNKGVSLAILAIPDALAVGGYVSGWSFAGIAFGPVGRSARRDPETSTVEPWLELLEQIDPTGWAVIARGHRYSRPMVDALGVPGLTVAVDEPAEISAIVLEETRGSQLLLLRVDNEVHVVRLRVVGRAAVHGALLAVGVGLALGMPLNEIVRILPTVDQIPGYLRRAGDDAPCPIFVDVCPSLTALEEALRDLRRATPGSVYCVLAGQIPGQCARGVPEFSGKADWLRLLRAIRFADFVYLVDAETDWQLPAGTAYSAVGLAATRGRKSLGERLLRCTDVENALAKALKKVSRDDVLVVVSLGEGGHAAWDFVRNSAAASSHRGSQIR